jgi:HNH endonuclease
MERRKAASKDNLLLEDQKARTHALNVWVRKWTKTRNKTICKPCWELNYCPYGPLVEQFPLPYKTVQDAEEDKMSKSDREKTCSVFGHICPVFFVSEPFTETGQLRYVSRHIPRPILIRVVRRDDSTCQVCGTHLLDNEIQIDHLIPYARGGPTTESNLRVICGECNNEKSDKLEL